MFSSTETFSQFGSQTRWKVGLLVLLSCLLFGGSAQANSKLFNQALLKTQREDFQGAIRDLRSATEQFNRNGEYANGYKSQLLIKYLEEDMRRREVARKNPDGDQTFLPSWYRLGSCLDGNCNYAVEWISPPESQHNFGGLLILTKTVNSFQDSRGLAQPIFALVDVKIVPPLRKNSTLLNQCGYQRKNNPNPVVPENQMILAIIPNVNESDRTAQDNYTKILRAWKADVSQRKITEISVKGIVCARDFP